MYKLTVEKRFRDKVEYVLQEFDLERFKECVGDLEDKSHYTIFFGKPIFTTIAAYTFSENDEDPFTVYIVEGRELALAEYKGIFYQEKYPELLNIISYQLLQPYWKQEEEEYTSRHRDSSVSTPVGLAMTITLLNNACEDLSISVNGDEIYLFVYGAMANLTREDFRSLWVWGASISPDEDDCFVFGV